MDRADEVFFFKATESAVEPHGSEGHARDRNVSIGERCGLHFDLCIGQQV
jgi:hypothetical protein